MFNELTSPKDKNTLEKYYDEDDIGRQNRDLNGYKGNEPTGLYARALTTTGGSKSYIDPETGELVRTEFKVTDYEVSRSSRFRNSTIVRNVEAERTYVLDPRGRGASLGIYGQVDVRTSYGIASEFRTIRLDRIDHSNLHRAYLSQR